MPALKYSVGDIVFINFPFAEDNTQRKLRPGLIVETKVGDTNSYLVLYCTSQKPKFPNEFWLEFTDFFIKVPTYVNTCRAFEFYELEIQKRLGSIPQLQLSIVIDRYNKCKQKLS